MQRDAIREALRSIERKTRMNADSGALTGEDVGLDPAMLDEVRTDGKRRVELFSAKAASCKEGSFMVRVAGAEVSRLDNFAYVPYPADDAAPEAPLGFDDEDPPCPACWHTVLDVQHMLLWRDWGPSDAGPAAAARRAAVETATAAGLSDDEAAAAAAADAALARRSPSEHPEVELAPAPAAEFRILIGTMLDVVPPSFAAAANLETEYCTGTGGRRARTPDMLVPSDSKYLYAVLLSQVEAAMITALDTRRRPIAFLPPQKLSAQG